MLPGFAWVLWYNWIFSMSLDTVCMFKWIDLIFCSLMDLSIVHTLIRIVIHDIF